MIFTTAKFTSRNGNTADKLNATLGLIGANQATAIAKLSGQVKKIGVSKTDVIKGLTSAQSGDILLLQLDVPIDTVNDLAEVAKQKGMTVILNPTPAKELGAKLLSNVDIIALNATETEIITGISPDSEVELALAVKYFYKYGVKHVIINMEQRGAIVTYGNTIVPIEARVVTVVDKTGAGDAFIGAVASRLDMGEDIVCACQFASVASSLTVTKVGASESFPTLEQVEKIINN